MNLIEFEENAMQQVHVKHYLFWLLLICYLPTYVGGLELLEPYFSYTTEELQTIRALPPSSTPLTNEVFAQWDPLVYELASRPDKEGEKCRLTAYLYTAQRDFALISQQLTQKWVGNPASLIESVIHLFFADFQTPHKIESDPYSSKLSELVFSKVQKRYQQEVKHLKEAPIKEGPQYWAEKPPFFGFRLGSCQPWLLASVDNVQAIPPPDHDSIIWAYGLEEIREAQARVTPKKLHLMEYWAGKLGPESGNWYAILNRDLEQKNLSLPNFLFVRATFAMGYLDSFIAAFVSKYTYWVKRPHMRDPNIKELVRCPIHPSYPSGHSVTSAASATMLSYFFPEEKTKWQLLAFEAGNSRILAGIHYMYDNESGLIQGEKVGKAIITHLAPLEKQ